MRRPAQVTAACAVLFVLLAACEAPAPAGGPVTPSPPEPPARTAATEPDEPISGGTLRFAVTEPATVPFDATDPDSLIVVDSLFDSLTAWADNLAVRASAATRWETTDGGTTWVFHLREGATFHDAATPVTAGDFAFAWDLAVTNGAAGFHLRRVEGYEALREGEALTLEGVRVLGPHTLEVRLQEPYGAFPSVVAHPSLGPVPQTLWEADPGAFRRQPIGNGPFMAAEALVPGQFLRVQRFDGWRNGPEPALLDEVLFQFMDPDTAFVAFQQRRLQVSPLPVGAVGAALDRYGRAEEGYRGSGVFDGDTPTVYFLAFNVAEPPFDDPEVRRAVSLAIDRESLIDLVLDGNATPASSLVMPAVSGVAGACEACRHDPGEAARIFAEHRVDSVTLWFNDDGGHRPLAQQVREDLQSAGVSRVAFRAPLFGEFLELLEAGEAGLFRYGWQPEYPLADDVLFPLFHSGSIPPTRQEPVEEPAEEPEGSGEEPEQDAEAELEGEPAAGPDAEPGDGTGGDLDGDAAVRDPEVGAWVHEAEMRNYMGYADPEVDRLLADARATTGTMRRLYYHRRVEDIVLNRDQVVVPILFYRHHLVVDDRVVGFAVNPMGLIELYRVQLRRDPGEASGQD